jgi:hypothetical protein
MARRLLLRPRPLPIPITVNPWPRVSRHGSTNEVWPGLVEDDPAVPEVVLYFGQNIIGFLQIAFAGGSANHLGIRLAFSETQQYLTNR